jgi:class 3 adenylate cyclase
MFLLVLWQMPQTLQAQLKVSIFELEDMNKSHNLTPYLYVYEDVTNQMTFKQALSSNIQPRYQQLKPNQPLNPQSTYWGRVIIRDRLNWSTDWFLNIGGASFIECYVPDIQQQYTVKKSGGLRAGNEIDNIPFKRVGVPVTLFSNKQTVIFVKLKSIDHTPPFFNMALAKPITAQTQYYQKNTVRNLLQGLFQGILWIMLLYHLFIFLPTRDRAYLFYTFYLLAIAVANLSEGGFLTDYFLDNSPITAFYIEVVFGMTVEIFYFLFSRAFLDTTQKARLVDKIFSIWIVVRVVLLVVVLGILISSFNRPLAANIVYYSNALEDVLVIVILVLLYRALPKNKVLLFFLSGTLLLSLSTLIPFVFTMLSIAAPINWYIFSLCGVFLEILFFSLALGQRIRLIEDEKLKAQNEVIEMQKDANRKLEEKVKERTAEIEQQKEEIETQRDNLAELNDEISRQNKMVELSNYELSEKNEFIQEQHKLIEEEKAKSDELLLNILPEQTANELKEKGYATPQHYELVSVLFTDFKGFTKLAEKITPQEVIEELNYCFTAFDKILEKHNLEKIKTIGDAYMAAGGIPIANRTNPIDAVRAGLEMQAFMAQWKKQKEAEGLPVWELRLGIHTGEIIAGVVGKKKFAYDIWGDTVNLASRMESGGEANKVNISGGTYELIKDHFVCEYRGKLNAKNKGYVDMYFVSAPK